MPGSYALVGEHAMIVSLEALATQVRDNVMEEHHTSG